VPDSRRCFRRRWEGRGSGWGADQPVELADFAPFEIAAEAYDADVARLEPFNR
jgi:hypothetical protein